jgi:hypothetical protein
VRPSGRRRTPEQAESIFGVRPRLKDGLVGTGRAGVVARVTPPRMPPIALLSGADYRRIMKADLGALQFIKL